MTTRLEVGGKVVGQAAANERTRLVWIFGGAVVLRLLATPLNHPWDTQVWYNFMADLVQQHSPYDSFRELSFAARSGGQGLYYEYYAYPPGLIYLYYPLAHLYSSLFDPQMTPHFPAPGMLPAWAAPYSFTLLFKLPVIGADLATAVLLRRMAGLRAATLYLYNPYVILMSVWMFDSLMVLCLVAALYWLEAGRIERAALALAAGTLLKYVPIFVVPAVLIYLWHRRYSLRQIGGRFGLVYVLAVAVPVLPFWDGLLFVLGFHADRAGGGLSWQEVRYFLTVWFEANNWDAYVLNFSGAFGNILLGLGLLLTYGLIYRARLSALASFVAALVGYLAFTKLVNEVYVLPLLPLLLIALARQPWPALDRCYRLLWSLPVVYCLLNVPIFFFGLTFLGNFEAVDGRIVGFVAAYQPFREVALFLTLVGCLFTSLCLVTLRLALRLTDREGQPQC